MNTSPSSSVQEARAVFGKRLRDIRRSTGMTARALAIHAGWSESKASRMETGRTPPSDDDLLRYVTICGVPEQYEDLRAAAHGIDEMYVEWKRLQRNGLKRAQEAHVSLNARTHRFRIYEPGVVPGLLQTAG
ncbi:helix-turn-helix domain-containing protein [Streptomyces sp. NPDC085481]|uniref:helix-turn-helix domain-containing protein n=1 Tax=Streptomyces sp. NPDC085481 TaxID=3365727 RepID=UPI0037CDA663